MKHTAWFAVWIAAVSLVAYQALAWAYRPGEGRTGEAERPVDDELQAVILVHPDCPCTSATLELFIQAAQAQNPPFKTLILIPGAANETKNIALARKVSNAKIGYWAPGEIQRKFGITTSGHVLVWRNKELIFSGGITDGRGEGVKGAAYQAFLNALSGTKQALELPVYGCKAFSDEVDQ